MTADDIAYLSATEAVDAFRAGRLSPIELAQATLDRIGLFNSVVNAYNLVDAERALDAARASTDRWHRGEPLGPLDGVPVAIKDVILTRDWPTLRGSRVVDAAGPWDVDAPVTHLLRESGVVLLGKTTTPELGWKAVTDSPLSGVTRNPWDPDRTPGGSSGGSAAAVALGMATLSVGTDGGGSIRIPAGFCGIVGLKPTFGRVPVWPPSAFGTLSHAGPMARTVADTAMMLDVIGRPDPRDWQSLPPAEQSYTASLSKGAAGLRVAFNSTLGFAETDPEVAAAVAAAAGVLAQAGAQVEEVEPPFADPIDIFDVLWYTGAMQAISSRDAQELTETDPGLVEAAEEGKRFSARDYVDATMRRGAVGIAMGELHQRFDVLLTPTVPIPAFHAGRNVPEGWYSPRWPTWTPFSYPFNLTQQPAISVPCGLTANRLPIGLQIVGPRHRDDLVLRAADAYARAGPPRDRPHEDRLTARE